VKHLVSILIDLLLIIQYYKGITI